jgi:hypothetical protein
MAMGCKENFDPPYTAPTNGFLVVDGVINSGAGSTSIRLTRSVSLADSASVKNETGALVRVEGEDNSSFILAEAAAGTYSINQLSLSDAVKYRLHIITKDSRQYFSDFQSIIRTPAIDNIRWEQPSDLQLFVNTHDPLNKTWYYQWEFTETWEFHASFMPQLKYIYDATGSPYTVDYIFPLTQNVDATKYACWQTESSRTLLIGSSAKLSKDSIDLPIRLIPNASWKLSVLYSILVKQHGVSKTGYDFLQRMKKNTESTGTLFDAQPSELNGNIHSITDPTEIVIGFIDVADVVEKRIFIKQTDVKNWGYREFCVELEVPNIADSVRAFSNMSPTVANKLNNNGSIMSYNVAQPSCVDCTLRGSNVKPAFWP